VSFCGRLYDHVGETFLAHINTTRVGKRGVMCAYVGPRTFHCRVKSYASDAPSGMLFQNNTLVGNDNGVYVDTGAPPYAPYILFYNNLIVGGQDAWTTEAAEIDLLDLTTDYNFVYDQQRAVFIDALDNGGTERNFAYWRALVDYAGTPRDANGGELSADPFVDAAGGDYRLDPSLGLGDAGYDYADLSGDCSGSAIAVGCYLPGMEQIGAL
ncbi:MAG: hypothetical protein V3V08_06450, partial [Nannocystaceae bacterium]